jgi:hypothetical protein
MYIDAIYINNDINNNYDSKKSNTYLDNTQQIAPKINDNLSLIVENVNKYNLQPCRLTIMIKDDIDVDSIILNDTWSGLVIDKKWIYDSKLDGLTDSRAISYTRSLDDNITAIVTAPSLEMNKEWE